MLGTLGTLRPGQVCAIFIRAQSVFGSVPSSLYVTREPSGESRRICVMCVFWGDRREHERSFQLTIRTTILHAPRPHATTPVKMTRVALRRASAPRTSGSHSAQRSRCGRVRDSARASRTRTWQSHTRSSLHSETRHISKHGHKERAVTTPPPNSPLSLHTQQKRTCVEDNAQTVNQSCMQRTL